MQNERSEWLEVLVGKDQISLGCPYLCRTLEERAEEEEHLEALSRAQVIWELDAGMETLVDQGLELPGREPASDLGS